MPTDPLKVFEQQAGTSPRRQPTHKERSRTTKAGVPIRKVVKPLDFHPVPVLIWIYNGRRETFPHTERQYRHYQGSSTS